MNLKDYLLLMLEQKYRLTPEDGDVLKAIVSAIRHRDIPVALEACPRLDAFKECGIQGVYEVVKLNGAWFQFIMDLQHVKTQAEVYELLNGVMEHSHTGVAKIGLVLTSEWQTVGSLMAESFSTEEEPERKLEPAYDGWLATGMYKLVTPSTVEGIPDKVETFDLTANDSVDTPVEVLLARVIHAVFDSGTGQVDPRRLENVTKLLAQLFLHERAHHEVQFKKATENQAAAPTSAARIWPTDDKHWIYDAELSKLNVAWPTPMTSPMRAMLAGAIEHAAKFAVSRASAMGNSRVFNIEAFLHNMIVGLIGDGAAAEGDFDWATFVGVPTQVPVVEEPVVRQLRSVMPSFDKALPATTLELIGRLSRASEVQLKAVADVIEPPAKPAARPRAAAKAK